MAAAPAIPKGSLVLVTGANGYIASHVADQLMAAGYRVRGTSRSEDKARQMVEVFEKRHGKNSYESTIVSDISAPGAFDEAIKGCSGVAHVASDVTFRPDPNQVIPPMVEAMRNILRAAKAHSSVKRFVLTSSSTAVVKPDPNKEFHVTDKDWNEKAVELAWAPPPYNQDRGLAVYGASKVAGERAAWQFMREEKPQFEFNAVCPNMNIGEVIGTNGSTGGWVKNLYDGEEKMTELMRGFPPQFWIDVKDAARLHVAALTHKDVVNERLLGLAGPFNYETWVEELQKINPQKTFPPPLNHDKDLSTPHTDRSIEILKRFGQNGWTPLQTSLRELVGNA